MTAVIGLFSLKTIRFVSLLGVLTIGLSILTGCGEVMATVVSQNNHDGETVATEATSKVLSGSLVLTGSTSMADVATALGEGFTEQQSGVTVSVGGNGSGEGPTAVKNSIAQIGLLSRSLKAAENPELFHQYTIGYDGIVIIVNPSSSIKELTSQQLQKIFSGEINNWQEVMGVDAPIQRIGREAASGTRSAFEDLLGIEEPVYEQEQNSTGNIKQVVASNPNAIGYISISALDESVHGITIEGVSPSEETIRTGEYLLQRPFIMITLATNQDPLVESFLDYVFSEAGLKVIAEDGLVPNPKGREALK